MIKGTKNGNAEQSEIELSQEELIRRGANAIGVEVQELLADYVRVNMQGGQSLVSWNGYLLEGTADGVKFR